MGVHINEGDMHTLIRLLHAVSVSTFFLVWSLQHGVHHGSITWFVFSYSLVSDNVRQAYAGLD